MTKGILGRKIGMTSIFDSNGFLIPVTVVQAVPNIVLQKKTVKTDGYDAVQLGLEDLRPILANKPKTGHANKAETAPKRFVKEIRGSEMMSYEVGQEVKVDMFSEGEYVDVTGTSKGKGFTGPIKRNNQSRGPMAHGSGYHRGPGSMGSVDGARVFKGKIIGGHMGSETVTIQNLQVAKVDTEKNIILIRGNVPGAKKSLVMIKDAVKKNS
ncbi:50S ribosomal protein L3 [Mycoplasmatota bacterium]|nr:50S ribosomal protein L3 [Mycoplasmatota bacterium]